jgi:2-dehydropantoate 2-reductase
MNHRDRAAGYRTRVVVFGCGGIGGTIAAALANAGASVVVVTHNQAITVAVGREGIRSRRADGREVVAQVPVATDLADLMASLNENAGGRSDEGQARLFDVAFLAVPPNRLEQAAESAIRVLATDGVLVALANGLPEEKLAARFGDRRVVGAIVSFGASQTSPGVVEQTSDGGFTIGRLSGDVDDGVKRVAVLLAPLDPTGASPRLDVEGGNLTTELRGARFSKLAINCAISSLGTIGGDRLGALMRHRFVRRLCLEVMTEVVQVAQQLGVKLQKVAHTVDLEWLALDDDERLLLGSPGLLAKHTVLLAVGARYRRLRSSMLGAIERGREPPIEELNGEVVRLARSVGKDAPMNQAIVDAVWAIARHERSPSLSSLRALFEQTRSSSTSKLAS